jgi:hypothetical protein
MLADLVAVLQVLGFVVMARQLIRDYRSVVRGASGQIPG